MKIYNFLFLSLCSSLSASFPAYEHEPNTENDQYIAQLLEADNHYDFSDPYTENRPDTSNDAYLAQTLSEMTLYDLEPWMPKTISNIYNSYDLAVSNKVRYDMDVHQFNAATGLKTNLPLLLKEDIYSNPHLSFQEARATLEASHGYDTFEKKNVLKANLDRLQTHLASSKIESSETGTNIEELFSRVCSLAANNLDFTEQLLLNVCDNSETGGGCYPGHAGRLARLYVNFLRTQWVE